VFLNPAITQKKRKGKAVKDAKLRRMSEAQLVEELELYQFREALFEATGRIAHIGYYEWDYEYDRLDFCSEEYARIFDMSIKEVLESQDSWEKMILHVHPDDRERYAKVDNLLPDTESLDVEYRIIRKDGEIRQVREISIVVTDDAGKISGAFGMFQDTTDHKKYQKDLEYREALTQQAEVITDIGHYIFNLEEEKYVYLSPGYARIHGVTREQYLASASSREEDIDDILADDYQRVVKTYEQQVIDKKDFLVEYRIRRADGEIRWIREQCTVHRVSNGVIQELLGVLQDITSQKNTEEKLLEARDTLEATVEQRTRELAETVSRLEEEIEEREKISAELKFLANHDALTGLPSLRLCKDRLDRSLAESRRNNQKSAVMFVDLDDFKSVNDSFGHECGDLVLKSTADRIRAEIREIDTVARIGGDEFLVILSQISKLADTQQIAKNIIDQISQVINVNQHQITVGASVGIAIYPDDGTTSDELIRQADKAMYLIKHSEKK
jgi:diguanylate cyclase (GGDEF)-like protein/PAS domain S-box-containing protein